MAKRVSDEALVYAVLTHNSQKDIADALHISQRQVCIRLKDRAIQKTLSEHRRAVLDSINTNLVSASQKAVQTLVELLDSDSEKIRLSASVRVLQLSNEYIQMNDILQRIEQLEERGTADE